MSEWLKGAVLKTDSTNYNQLISNDSQGFPDKFRRSFNKDPSSQRLKIIEARFALPGSIRAGNKVASFLLEV